MGIAILNHFQNVSGTTEQWKEIVSRNDNLGAQNGTGSSSFSAFDEGMYSQNVKDYAKIFVKYIGSITVSQCLGSDNYNGLVEIRGGCYSRSVSAYSCKTNVLFDSTDSIAAGDPPQTYTLNDTCMFYQYRESARSVRWIDWGWAVGGTTAYATSSMIWIGAYINSRNGSSSSRRRDFKIDALTLGVAAWGIGNADSAPI